LTATDTDGGTATFGLYICPVQLCDHCQLLEEYFLGFELGIVELELRKILLRYDEKSRDDTAANLCCLPLSGESWDHFLQLIERHLMVKLMRGDFADLIPTGMRCEELGIWTHWICATRAAITDESLAKNTNDMRAEHNCSSRD
jgi:hypothetical protein